MRYKIPTPIPVSKNLLRPDQECWKTQELRVKEVQKITKGKGAKLCFLDDGIGDNEELLNLNIERWSYFSNAPMIGRHSTFGATVVAGKTLGIFPEMDLVSKQVLMPDSGVGGTKEIVSAIRQANKMGIQTINLSLGSDYPDKHIERALQEYCSNGINIATIASGNDGPGKNTTDYPARYAKTIKGVLSVAATQIDRDGNISVAMFSSRGIVTIGAPGHVLKSMNELSQIDFISGTSFSAPIIGATIAVARTLIDRDLTQDEIFGIIEETSKKGIDTKYNIGQGEISILDFLKRVKGLKSNPIKTPKTKKIKWICKILGCCK